MEDPVNIDSYLWAMVDAVHSNMEYEALLETPYVKSIRDCLNKYPDYPYSVTCACFLPWELVSQVCQHSDSGINLYYDIDTDSIIFESFDDMFNGLLHIANTIMRTDEYSYALDSTHNTKLSKYILFMNTASSIIDLNEVSEMMNELAMS